jgi:hypothetical protein
MEVKLLMNFEKIHLSLLFLILVCIGCSPTRPAGMPNLTPCKIIVTMEGKPVEAVTVKLFSDNLTWACTGRTNSSGVATLVTDMKYNGVPAGTYKILLTRIDVEKREYKGMFEEAKLPPKKQTVIIDLKYENQKETPFEIEIVDKKPASMTCEVTPPKSPDLPKNYRMTN